MRKKKLLYFIVFIFFLIPGFAQKITYKDVAPIFITKCASCHRNGDAAPFALTSYPDIIKRSSFIKEVITKKYMPPWRADVHYRDFANNRQLSNEEREKILQWINNGSPLGSDKPLENKTSLLDKTAYDRTPDLTLKIDSSFIIKGDNTERFIVFKIPFNLASEHNIEAVEFYTNNKKIIHHINYGFYEVADSSIDINKAPIYVNSIDDTDRTKDPYAQVSRKMIYYTGWIPGASVEDYPQNFGWVLPKRGVALLTTHYSAIAAEEKSIVGVNFFLEKSRSKDKFRLSA